VGGWVGGKKVSLITRSPKGMKLKIGIVGTYLRIGIVALIFRNYGTLPYYDIYIVYV
jgi:hypothetical protein